MFFVVVFHENCISFYRGQIYMFNEDNESDLHAVGNAIKAPPLAKF